MERRGSGKDNEERERKNGGGEIKENPRLSPFIHRRIFCLQTAALFSPRRRRISSMQWMKVEFIVNRGEVKWRGWIESSREMVSRVKEEAEEDLPTHRGETIQSLQRCIPLYVTFSRYLRASHLECERGWLLEWKFSKMCKKLLLSPVKFH